jgi:hypothetical protein
MSHDYVCALYYVLMRNFEGVIQPQLLLVASSACTKSGKLFEGLSSSAYFTYRNYYFYHI